MRLRKLRAGAAGNEVAREFGVHPSTIARLKKRLNAMANDEAGAIMVGLRLSREEEAQLRGRVARSDQHTKSSYLRKVARVALDFPELSEDEGAAIRRLEHNLGRVGSNLNQIAKALNVELKRTGSIGVGSPETRALHKMTIELRNDLQSIRDLQDGLLRKCQRRSASLLAEAGG